MIQSIRRSTSGITLKEIGITPKGAQSITLYLQPRHSAYLPELLVDLCGAFEVTEMPTTLNLLVSSSRDRLGHLTSQVRRNHQVVGETDHQARHGDPAVGGQPVREVLHLQLRAHAGTDARSGELEYIKPFLHRWPIVARPRRQLQQS